MAPQGPRASGPRRSRTRPNLRWSGRVILRPGDGRVLALVAGPASASSASPAVDAGLQHGR